MELEVKLFYSSGTLDLSLDIKVKDRVQLHVRGNRRNSGLRTISVVARSVKARNSEVGNLIF